MHLQIIQQMKFLLMMAKKRVSYRQLGLTLELNPTLLHPVFGILMLMR